MFITVLFQFLIIRGIEPLVIGSDRNWTRIP